MKAEQSAALWIRDELQKALQQSSQPWDEILKAFQLSAASQFLDDVMKPPNEEPQKPPGSEDEQGK